MRLTLTEDNGTQVASIDVTPDQWADALDPNRTGDAAALVDRLAAAQDTGKDPS